MKTTRMGSALVLWAVVGCVCASAGEGEAPDGGGKPKPKKPDKPKEEKKLKFQTEAQYLLDLAGVHRQYGHLDEALPLLNKALELEKEPELKLLILQQAGETALADPKHADAASAYFAKALELAEDDGRKSVLLLWLGGAYRTAKDYAKAEAAFWAAYKSFSDKRQKQDALRQFTDILRRPERTEAAEAEYTKRQAEKPGDPDTLEILALLYTQGPKKDTKKAQEIQEKVVAARPDDLDELETLAGLFQQNGQADKAVGLFRQIVAKKPAEQEKLARALAQAGKPDEAAGIALKLLEGHDQDPQVLDHVASLLDQFGKKKESLALREKSVGLLKDPQARTDALFRLADQYRSMKEYPKCEDLVRKLLQEAAAEKPPADAKPEDVKAFKERVDRNIARGKKALFQLYEEQGKLEELKF